MKNIPTESLFIETNVIGRHALCSHLNPAMETNVKDYNPESLMNSIEESIVVVEKLIHLFIG